MQAGRPQPLMNSIQEDSTTTAKANNISKFSRYHQTSANIDKVNKSSNINKLRVSEYIVPERQGLNENVQDKIFQQRGTSENGKAKKV